VIDDIATNRSRWVRGFVFDGADGYHREELYLL